MSFEIHVSGRAEDVVDATLPRLVDDLVASGITAGDTVCGPGGSRRGLTTSRLGRRRLGVAAARPRDRGAARGSRRARHHAVVLAGIGGSSLAPEVIAATAGVPLVHPRLDRARPGPAAIDGGEIIDDEGTTAGGLAETVLVVSSKSGSTVENRLRAARLRSRVA